MSGLMGPTVRVVTGGCTLISLRVRKHQEIRLTEPAAAVAQCAQRPGEPPPYLQGRFPPQVSTDRRGGFSHPKGDLKTLIQKGPRATTFHSQAPGLTEGAENGDLYLSQPHNWHETCTLAQFAMPFTLTFHSPPVSKASPERPMPDCVRCSTISPGEF